ncbi:MAG: DNA polymerase III subunit alpha, partial [Candidatus Omnitrophota bacterium]|nr:DNA polymerase III subunit alpha [Candidatus Omnitrophota bacterium]
MISYRTAFLKANYPVEFTAALLTSEKDNTDKIVQYIDEAARMNIKVLPPDVNESFADFTIVDKRSIRFGLGAVKNVGRTAIESIVKAREKGGTFKSLSDFCERTDSRLCNKKVLESLIKCGAFDSLGLKRSQMMAILNKAMEKANVRQKEKSLGQMLLFDEVDLGDEAPDIKEWPESQLLNFEKEMLGFYITGHPLAKYEKLLREYSTASSHKLKSLGDGTKVRFGGFINKVKHTVTKRTGEKMAIMMMEDLDGTVEVLVFPSSYKNVQKFVRPNFAAFVDGKLNLRDEVPKIIVEGIVPIEEVRKRFTRSVTVDIVSQAE